MDLDIARLNQILMVYAWFPLSALLAILLLIARFYQKQTGESTRFSLFLAPLVLFGVAAIYNARANQVIGVVSGDLVMMAGGVVLTYLCWTLLRTMTTGR